MVLKQQRNNSERPTQKILLKRNNNPELFSENKGIIFKVQNKMPSTVIRSIEYNTGAAVLTIMFVTGSVYEYYDVPQEVYEQFKSYREKGVFYNGQIKGKYRFKRVS